jgi:hypothetical protein
VGDTPTNNRVTTKQFYEQLMATHERMNLMERRILDKLEPLAQVQVNKDEIDKLRNRSNIIDGANTLIALVAATIAGIVGSRAP